MRVPHQVFARARWLAADASGASAVEFAIIGLPLILILLMVLQTSIFYMAQSSLDAGLIQEADALTSTFNSSTAPVAPSNAQLIDQIAARSGGLIRTSTLKAEVVPFSGLTKAVVPIGALVSFDAPGSVLALRAQAEIPTFLPGFRSVFHVRASALLRRRMH